MVWHVKAEGVPKQDARLLVAFNVYIKVAKPFLLTVSILETFLVAKNSDLWRADRKDGGDEGERERAGNLPKVKFALH